MTNQHDRSEQETRYGLTALGHEALDGRDGDAVRTPTLDIAPAPLRRVRRARTRVRALVRALSRRT